jgi:hypothetical protein
MRHLWSLLSGIAAAVATTALFAIDPRDVTGQLQVGRIVVVGLLLGLVAATRISPVGPIVGGLLLLTPVVMLEISSGLYTDLFVANDYATDLGGLHLQWFEISRANGFMAMAGAMMIMAAVSVQRWRAWPRPVDVLVDNGPGGGAPLDDALPSSAAANDGTTEQLWVQPR